MEQKPLMWMIIFGIVRAALVFVGAKLQDWNVIDDVTRERLISDWAAQIVGYVLVFGAVLWSVIQKSQVWGWVLTALKLDKRTEPKEVPTAAPGPNIAI